MLFSSLYMYSSWAMLALRLALAAIFFVHGTPKVKAAAQMAPTMGLSVNFVTVLGGVETISAALMLFGLLTQLSALAMIIVMIGALYYKIQVWNVQFFEMTKTGWEFDLLILCSALIPLTMGSGMLSLDWMLGWY